MKRQPIGVLAAAWLLVAASAHGQARPQATAATPQASAATQLSAALEATSAAATPAIVQIFTTSYTAGSGVVPRTADLITTERASGSGVIVDPAGFIVTNAHVVAGAQRVRVELPVRPVGQSILAVSSRTVTGQVIGIDVETDIAVVKVEDKNLPALAFGNSEEIKPGQIVLALGSPLGLNNSVSIGVVSAVARQLEPESPMIYVQTDAPINPGSSGGALVDVTGRLLGINTMIVSRGGGNEGLGFAAPGNIVKSVYEQIRQNGRVRRGDIGLRAQTITPTLAAGLKLPRESGVVISDVLPNSGAARAGLRPGDIVLTLDGRPMENGRQLQVGLYRRLVGDIVTLEVLRDGQVRKEPIAMDERRDGMAGLAAAADPRQALISRLGILGVTLDARMAQMVPVIRVQAGVLVASTAAGALEARQGGFAPGDVIYAINRSPINTMQELRTALESLKTGDSVVVNIERAGSLLYLAFSME